MQYIKKSLGIVILGACFVSIIFFINWTLKKMDSVASLIPSSTQLAAVSGAGSQLVAHYTFDGNANDSAGSNNGTAVGGPTYTTGKIGQAIQMDGVDDYVQGSIGVIGAGDTTVCAWIKPTSLSTMKSIVDNTVAIFAVLDGNIRLSSDGGTTVSSEGNSISAGIWQHACATRASSGVANIYINGSLSGPANQNNGTPRTSGWYTNIGAYGTGATQFFPGSIDDVRIYSRVLPLSDIQEIYALGGGVPGQNPVNGSCGLAAKSYTVNESFPSGAYCSSGTANPSSATNPSAGSSSSWTCSGTNGGNASPTCTASRTSSTQPTSFLLTVSKSGSGTVTGTGFSCGSDCTETVTSGTSVVLTAVPDSGYTTSWSGCTSTNGNVCNITVNSNTTVTATFTATQSGGGGTVTAASCSLAHVQSAVNSATDGATVIVPAGTCTWTSTLNITKAITLQGAGACAAQQEKILGQCGTNRTVILDNVAGGGALINMTGVANKTSRITGFEFRDGGRTGSGQVIRLSSDGYDGRRMRLDHNRFDHLKAFAIRPEGVVGVIDHNQFYGTPTNIFIYSFYQFTGNDPVHSDNSWARPINWGSQDFLFIENNHFEYDTAYYAVNDGFGGARVVFRYNTVVQGWFEQHGTESGGRARGTRGGEVYNNTFECKGLGNGILTNFRSGTWLVHNNTAINCPYTPFFSATAYRNIGPSQPIGGADGTNPWDKNVPGGPFLTGTITSGGINGRPYATVSSARWSPDQWAGYSIRKTSGAKSCSSLTHSGGIQPTATITCTGHGLKVNDWFTLRGVNQIAYMHATGRVTEVVNGNTFKFLLSWGMNPTTPATGTFTITSGQDFAYIRSNTADTFSLDFPANLPTVTFAAGDTFALWKVDQSIDQACVGQGANLGGAYYPSIPSGWPNQISEGCYEWNNKTSTGGDINIDPQYPAQVRSGEHFFNNTCKPGYTPYTYPHPLTGLPSQSQPLNCPGSVPSSTLNVAKSGTGTGTVTGGAISCGSTCSAVVPNGTAITLVAIPTSGSTFSGWSGGGCSGAGICSVTVNNSTTVTATFTSSGGTADTTSPSQSSIAASSVSTTGATISWTTNEPSTTQVQYGITTSYGNSTTHVSTLTTSHSQQLTSLLANTLYHYRVISTDAAGNTATSGDGIFSTLPIVAVNTPPVLSLIGSRTIAEVSTLSFTTSATDAEGNTLSYSATNLPSGATYNTSTGFFSFIPSYAQVGVYSVTFNVSDGQGGLDSELVIITVTNTNRPPVAGASQGVILPSVTLSATTSSDPDLGTTLSYAWTKTSGPSATIVSPTLATTSVILTTAGTYVFQVQVSDGSLSSTYSVTVPYNQGLSSDGGLFR